MDQTSQTTGFFDDLIEFYPLLLFKIFKRCSVPTLITMRCLSFALYHTIMDYFRKYIPIIFSSLRMYNFVYTHAHKEINNDPIMDATFMLMPFLYFTNIQKGMFKITIYDHFSLAREGVSVTIQLCEFPELDLFFSRSSLRFVEKDNLVIYINNDENLPIFVVTILPFISFHIDLKLSLNRENEICVGFNHSLLLDNMGMLKMKMRTMDQIFKASFKQQNLGNILCPSFDKFQSSDNTILILPQDKKYISDFAVLFLDEEIILKVHCLKPQSTTVFKISDNCLVAQFKHEVNNSTDMHMFFKDKTKAFVNFKSFGVSFAIFQHHKNVVLLSHTCKKDQQQYQNLKKENIQLKSTTSELEIEYVNFKWEKV